MKNERWIKLGWNKLLEEIYYNEISYNETRTVTRKENKIKSLFYSIRDLRLRETAGAKLHRRRRWRNSWNPWRNVRSSITQSVLEDFSFFRIAKYPFVSRPNLIRRESNAPGYTGTRQYFSSHGSLASGQATR